MTWNVIMGIGLLMIVGGFLGFIFCEMKEREIDRKIAENQHFIDAILNNTGEEIMTQLTEYDIVKNDT